VFTVDRLTEESQPIIQVLFGEVNLNLYSDANVLQSEESVTQGSSYANGQTEALSQEEEKDGLEEWDPGFTPQERVAKLDENKEERQEISDFAQNVHETIRDESEFRQQLKEEDFAAGRTLTDIHGNLVRVDQRLERPDSKTIQVVNVVKREGYSSSGLRRYAYAGPTTGIRRDVLIAKAEFNNALPEQVSEFPSYFEGKENKLDKTALILASNTGGADAVFTIGFFGKRDAATDDIKPDLYVGTLSKGSGFGGEFRNVYDLRIDDNKNVAGLSRFAEDTTIASVDVDGTGGDLYGYTAKRFLLKSDNTKKIWLAGEGFVINNSGKLRNVSDFTNSTNIEDALNNSAGQLAFFVKQDTANSPDLHADVTSAAYFAGGNTARNNIDIVLITDVVISMVKSFASGLGNISDGFE
ncbi:MAG: hypothetical protein HYY63_02950, partial [Elusimicrobia bacterium]|nr:hypothetical protein [Elusimicrobiota bacterium]